MTVEALAPVTYQNIGTVTGFLIVPRGSGVVNVYNGDIVNVLLVSPSSTPSLSNSVPIQPLTNATIDGSRHMYASAQSGTVAQVVVSASAQISPSPAQIAQQISALGLATLAQQITQQTAIPNNIATTGAPLLNLSTQILNAAVTTVNAGTTTTFPGAGTLAINQPGAELIISLESAGATAQAKITINWLDGTGAALSQDIYWVYAGTTGNPHALYLYGPTDGLQFTVSISAFTAAVKVDKLLVYLNSKIYSRWNCTSESMPALANGAVGLSIIEPQSNIIGHRVPAVIAAGASDNTTLAMYVGKAWLYFNTSSNINDATVKLQNLADQSAAGGDNYITIKSDGAGNINSFIQMPRGQSVLQMTNLNAANMTLRYTLVTAEY